MHHLGVAKLVLGADAEAIAWLRQCLEANRNYPIAHFQLAAALALLGDLEEGRSAVKAGLALNPTFTVRRMRSSVLSGNAIYLAGRERVFEGIGWPECRKNELHLTA